MVFPFVSGSVSDPTVWSPPASESAGFSESGEVASSGLVELLLETLRFFLSGRDLMSLDQVKRRGPEKKGHVCEKDVQ